MASFLTRFQQLLHRIRSGAVEFDTDSYQRQLWKINSSEEHFRDCRDDQLRAAAQSLTDRAVSEIPRPRLLADAFALVREVASLLQQRAADCYRRLLAEFGEQRIREGEKQITLFHINQGWADHLARVAEIREQVHLFSMGGYNPLDEFHRRINQSMTETLARIDDEIVATFERVEFTEDGLDLPKYGLTGPSSTWTYMINDTPMGDVLDRVTQGLKRQLTGRRGAA